MCLYIDLCSISFVVFALIRSILPRVEARRLQDSWGRGEIPLASKVSVGNNGILKILENYDCRWSWNTLWSLHKQYNNLTIYAIEILHYLGALRRRPVYKRFLFIIMGNLCAIVSLILSGLQL